MRAERVGGEGGETAEKGGDRQGESKKRREDRRLEGRRWVGRRADPPQCCTSTRSGAQLGAGKFSQEDEFSTFNITLPFPLCDLQTHKCKYIHTFIHAYI